MTYARDCYTDKKRAKEEEMAKVRKILGDLIRFSYTDRRAKGVRVKLVVIGPESCAKLLKEAGMEGWYVDTSRTIGYFKYPFIAKQFSFR